MYLGNKNSEKNNFIERLQGSYRLDGIQSESSLDMESG